MPLYGPVIMSKLACGKQREQDEKCLSYLGIASSDCMELKKNEVN